MIAYWAEWRQGGVYSTRHQGWAIRSPMVSSVTTTAWAGMRAAAYACTSANTLSFCVGTRSQNETHPATTASPTAAHFRRKSRSHCQISDQKKQYAGMRISAKYCGNRSDDRPNTTTPAAIQANSTAFPAAGCQPRARKHRQMRFSPMQNPAAAMSRLGVNTRYWASSRCRNFVGLVTVPPECCKPRTRRTWTMVSWMYQSWPGTSKMRTIHAT